MGMTPTVTKEHEWLRQLVGDWLCEGQGEAGPDQMPLTWKAEEVVRMIGDVWVQCEGRGDMPGGGFSTTQMTLGYDPATQRFVGTFIGSMMTHLWVYEGRLDAAGKMLTLDSEGPDFSGQGSQLAKYQDIIELVTTDHRVLRSQVLGADGRWTPIMSAHYHRKR